ncbi:hypothetical protein MGG_04098 [Pyricularia oryzae 70-15]|uniref:Uncharacterized protein n=1 Tax=Pyricularia oryzae (strain 70-15 / ATCC MYA-4617 / FGSC 8958) TaxID=242507 RepID=G4NGK9_PYRO7|nr:uncharacterized protein MGG_04098 [Pyricularia oryzae 70-15]EHA47369.1 hypothetical protein MGG_04098 [Pyricularia oryzae 70-15]KAI7916148.1 hypothetical protein M9X92_008026 [Pyricularia oryzae]
METRSGPVQDRKRDSPSQDSPTDGAATAAALKRQRIVETDPAVISQTLAENQPTGISNDGIMIHLQPSFADRAHVLEQISSLPDGPLKQALLGALQPQALLSVPEQLVFANKAAAALVSTVLDHQLRIQPPRAAKWGDSSVNDAVFRRIQSLLHSDDLEHIDDVRRDFLIETFAEMVVNWMDVRFRTMDDHGIQAQAWRPQEEQQDAEPARTPWHTRQFVSAMIHGGNLGHDAVFVVLDVIITRYHGGESISSSRAALERKGVLDSFKLMYSLDADQALWLAQRAWLQKEEEVRVGVGVGEFVKTVRLINRYVSWYGNPLYMGTRGKNRRNLIRSKDAEKAWIEFIEVVCSICMEREARLSEKMARNLRAKSRALVSECQQLDGWARGEELPRWEVAQVEHLVEVMDVGDFE